MEEFILEQNYVNLDVYNKIKDIDKGKEKDNQVKDEKDKLVFVPILVSQCIEYLEKYGLHQLGLFRVNGDKSIIRQLFKRFETGI